MQMGIRPAVVSACPQIRHGAGKSTAANASSVRPKITEALLTEGVLAEATLNAAPREGRS